MTIGFKVPFTMVRVLIYGSFQIVRTTLYPAGSIIPEPGRTYCSTSFTFECEYGPIEWTKREVYAGGKGYAIECMPIGYHKLWTLFSFGTRPLTEYKPWLVLFNHQFN